MDTKVLELYDTYLHMVTVGAFWYPKEMASQRALPYTKSMLWNFKAMRRLTSAQSKRADTPIHVAKA